MVRKVQLATLSKRASRIRLVLTDVDGVLTDGGVYYDEEGEVYKRFSMRDGMGVERLREVGIETAFITRERSPIVTQRAQKLRLKRCYLGIEDKAATLGAIIDETSLNLEQLAYIGDDVNDLGLMQAIGERGLTASPLDAMPEVARCVHYHCRLPGGQGAFREFAEWILQRRSDKIESQSSTGTRGRTS